NLYQNMLFPYMILWPLLYTDTSEAWKLHERRARLAIGGAGVVAELMLAVGAALAWSVLPDGALRSAAYILAAVTWVSTVAVNLNPFMRFDGYYLLMDALDIPNLSERSFAIARWQLRRTLLGVDVPMPQPQLAARRYWLCAYAYLTWIYRVVLFTGIAAAVYYLFFKLAGVLLFGVEIVWFVLRPIANELQAWRQLRARWGRRARVNALALALLVLALALPWRADVQADGYWQAREDSRVYPPAGARLAAILVKEGQAVTTGQVLFQLNDPQIDSQWTQLQSRIEGLEAQLAGAIGQAGLRDAAPVFEQQLAAAKAEQQLQNQERERLSVRAPHAGVVRDIDRGLYAGAWVGPRHVLGRVVGGGESLAYLFVHESQISRVRVGAPVRLLTRRADPQALDAVVTDIDRTAIPVLPQAMLASVHGGPIAARARPDGELVANEALYRVTVRVPMTAPQLVPVAAHIEGERSSVLWDFVRRCTAVVVRESGF
ncbi:MAG: efflux RND transporter periplasmic adaptor subunit, partial [Massilia sp.]